MIRQSFCYPIWAKAAASPEDLFAKTKAMGFAATEFWSWENGGTSRPVEAGDSAQDEPGYDHVVRLAKEAGLTVCSFTGHDGIQSGLNDPSQHDRIHRELVESLDRAAHHAIPSIIVFAGERIPGQSDIAGLRVCARALKRLAPLAEERGVNLNLELLNSKVDHFNYLGDRTDWAIALCEMVGSPRVRILFDVYHVQINEGDVMRNLEKALPYLGHVHTAGNPGRHELDDRQELNYRGICSLLSDAGYQGYVGHEFFARQPDKLRALQEAFQVCNL